MKKYRVVSFKFVLFFVFSLSLLVLNSYLVVSSSDSWIDKNYPAGEWCYGCGPDGKDVYWGDGVTAYGCQGCGGGGPDDGWDNWEPDAEWDMDEYDQDWDDWYDQNDYDNDYFDQDWEDYWQEHDWDYGVCDYVDCDGHDDWPDDPQEWWYFEVNGYCLDPDGDGCGMFCSGCGMDCGSHNPNVNPWSDEVCDNGLDDDCDAWTDCCDYDCRFETECAGVDPNEDVCAGSICEEEIEDALPFFGIKDGSGNFVAKIDQRGVMWIGGGLVGEFAAGNNDLLIKNSGGSLVSAIGGDVGNLYLDGAMYTNTAELNPSSYGNFVIKNADGESVAWFTSGGDLHLKGCLIGHYDPGSWDPPVDPGCEALCDDIQACVDCFIANGCPVGQNINDDDCEICANLNACQEVAIESDWEDGCYDCYY